MMKRVNVVFLNNDNDNNHTYYTNQYVILSFNQMRVIQNNVNLLL